MVPNKTTLSHSRKCLLVYTSCKVIAVSGCSCPKLAHEATSADMLILESQSKWLSVWLESSRRQSDGRPALDVLHLYRIAVAFELRSLPGRPFKCPVFQTSIPDACYKC